MKNNSKKYLIIFATLAVISVAGYIYLTYYISGLTAKTTALKSDIDLSQIKYFRLESLRKATENTSDQKQKVANLFINNSGAIDFISYIEDLAKSSNLSYNTKSIENSTAGNLAEQNKDLLTITISTTGSWSNSIKFIKLIESLPYSVRIESLDMSSNVVANSHVNTSSSVSSNVDTNASSSDTSFINSSKWNLTVKFSVIELK